VDRDDAEVVGRRGRDRRTSRGECILIVRVFGLQIVTHIYIIQFEYWEKRNRGWKELERGKAKKVVERERKIKLKEARGRRTLAETSFVIGASTLRRRGLSSFVFELLGRGGRGVETVEKVVELAHCSAAGRRLGCDRLRFSLSFFRLC
jgi:hypothetical protein